MLRVALLEPVVLAVLEPVVLAVVAVVAVVVILEEVQDHLSN